MFCIYSAADTWACLYFPTMFNSHLSATEDDVLVSYFKCLVCALWHYTCAHCVTGLLELVMSKFCAIIMFGIQLV